MWVDQLGEFAAIFFDLDGTLYDDTQYDLGAFAQIAACFPPQLQLQQRLLRLKQQQGRHYTRLFDHICVDCGLTDHDAQQMVAMYRAYVPPVLQMDPTAEHQLALLKNRAYLFLVTNGRKSTQSRKIQALGLRSIFTEIFLCDGTEHWPLKPDPTVYRYAQKKFQFGSAVMVGDTVATDQKFADNAGIPFLYHSVIQYI